MTSDQHRDALLARWRQIQPLLDELLDLETAPREARAAALAAQDPDLAPLLRAFLQDADTAARFAPIVADRAAGAVAMPADVGDYEILREIGRGGMSRVFLARRADQPVAPPVAVKVLDAPPGAADLSGRFDRERQTLARLRHPHITHWMDGGVDAQGRAYLVMEYVDGPPIDRYCDERRLPVEARLRLFGDVCAAVAHAHGQLVVHRDLKPSNVLVDAHGQVKLLDFGIAKWLEALDGVDVLQTTTQYRPLTPSHAAPEQFLSQPITTATDVYQLGLLLYVLLTGRRAHVGVDAAALRHAVLEVDVDRPSRAAAGGGAGVESGDAERRAADRATTPAALARRLAGDADAVVLKALAREPGDRYATVDALRQDVERMLDRRPVSARHYSAWAAAGRLVRRHRAATAAAGGVLVSGLVGLVAFSIQARATALERDRALAAEARAAAINSFLVDELLTAETPERSLGRPPGVADVLDQASRVVGPALRDQPDVEAAVRDTLSRSYAALGRVEPALAHAQAADALLARTLPADDPRRLRARVRVLERQLDESHFDAARAALPAIVDAQRRILGPAHADTIGSRAMLGRALKQAGENVAAAIELRAALADAAALPDAEWRTRALVLADLASCELELGHAAAAVTTSQTLVDLTRARAGADHPAVADALALLARAQTGRLDYRQALDTSHQVVALCERLYGADHPKTGRARLALGAAHSRFQQDRQAVDETRRAYDILARALGPEHRDTVMALRNLAVTHRYAGNLSAAEDGYREVAAIRERTLGRWHRDTLEGMSLVQSVIARAGRTAEARRLGREVIARYAEAVERPGVDPMVLDDFAALLCEIQPADLADPERAGRIGARAVEATGRTDYAVLRTLVAAQVAANQREAALATAREALALPQAIQSWSLEAQMVDLLRAQRPPREVEAWLLERLAQFGRLRRGDDFLAGQTLRHLAMEYDRQGRFDDADRRFGEALAQFRRHAPDSHFQILRLKSDYGAFLAARRRFAEAEPLLLDAARGLAADPAVTPAHTERAQARLAALHKAMGQAPHTPAAAIAAPRSPH